MPHRINGFIFAGSVTYQNGVFEMSVNLTLTNMRGVVKRVLCRSVMEVARSCFWDSVRRIV